LCALAARASESRPVSRPGGFLLLWCVGTVAFLLHPAMHSDCLVLSQSTFFWPRMNRLPITGDHMVVGIGTPLQELASEEHLQ
jgi:hypothetical protein